MGPPDSLLDQICNPQYKKNEHPFGPANQENHHLVGHSDNDDNQTDEVDDIIESFFADPDVYSPVESTQQDTDVAVSDYTESANQVITVCLAWIFLLGA